MEEKKTKRGGARKGAGRKPAWDEPTVTVAFRVPKATKDDIDQMKAAGVDFPRWMAKKVRQWMIADFFEKFNSGKNLQETEK